MTPSIVSAEERRRLADAKRAARARRISMIRRRIVGGAVAVFVAAFGVMTVQLVTGHDPALASSSTKRSATTAVGASSSPTTSSSSSGTTASSGTASSGSGSSSGSGTSSSGSGASSVTTRQS